MFMGLRSRSWFRLALVAVLGLSSTAWGAKPKAKSTEPDPRVQPGARFFLEFPSLPVDRKGDPAKAEVRLPKDYNRNTVYPLAVWLGGGEGSSNIGGELNVVADPDKFILAALPYPKGANNPQQANMVGNFPAMWTYHQAMLEELYRVVPNVNPGFRILAGFSNGGHTIHGYLGLPGGPVVNYFNVFVLADGGGSGGSSRYPAMNGCFVYSCWGTVGTTNKDNAPMVISAAQRSGATAIGKAMPGVGHAFAPEFQKDAHDWIYANAVPALVPTWLVEAKKASTKKPGDAIAFLNSADMFLDADSKDAKAAAKLRDQIDDLADKELAKLTPQLAEDQPETKKAAAKKKLEQFVQKYAGTKKGDEAAELLKEVGVSSKDDKTVAADEKEKQTSTNQ